MGYRWLVIYSSVTGNTKKVAEAIGGAVDAEIVPVEDAPEDVAGYDLVAVGYWLWRGGPDPKSAACLARLRNVRVVLFETHATENRSEHAVTAFARAGTMLGEGCSVIGVFECQGQVSEAIRKRHESLTPNDPHAKSTGWKTSVGHPDDADIENARAFALRVEEKLDRFGRARDKSA